MRYPTLESSGSVVFASIEDHRSLWPEFLSKGGLLVEFEAPVAPLQQLEIVLSGGALRASVRLATEVAFISGGRAMLRFREVSPETLRALDPSEAAAANGVTAAANDDAPKQLPSLVPGDRLVFADTASFIAARKEMAASGLLLVRSVEPGVPRAEVWIEIRVGAYHHPVLLAAKTQPAGGDQVSLQFSKGLQFAREIGRIDEALGTRPRRPHSGLVHHTLERLRTTGSRSNSNPSWVDPSPLTISPRPSPEAAPRRQEPKASALAEAPPARVVLDSIQPEEPLRASEPSRAAPASSAAQQMAKMRRSGDFSNPRRPSQFLALPALRAPTDDEVARPSTLLLFRWLSGNTATQMVQFQVSDKTIEITVQGREDLRSDTPLAEMAKLLAEPSGTYKVTELAQPPVLPHPARTRAVMVDILRYSIRRFTEADSQAEVGSKKYLSPKLKPGSDKIVESMAFPPPLQRIASRMLRGQHRLEEILQSGIGAKSGWEILYLLELFGALEWVALDKA